MQWRRQNFSSEKGDIQQKCNHQRILKNCEKYIKKIEQNLNILKQIFKNEI